MYCMCGACMCMHLKLSNGTNVQKTIEYYVLRSNRFYPIVVNMLVVIVSEFWVPKKNLLFKIRTKYHFRFTFLSLLFFLRFFVRVNRCAKYHIFIQIKIYLQSSKESIFESIYCSKFCIIGICDFFIWFECIRLTQQLTWTDSQNRWKIYIEELINHLIDLPIYRMLKAKIFMHALIHINSFRTINETQSIYHDFNLLYSIIDHSWIYSSIESHLEFRCK